MAHYENGFGNWIIQYSDDEKKIFGLWCAYYAYLENIDRQHEMLNGRTYPFPSSSKSHSAEQARRNTQRRLGLFGEGIDDSKVRDFRDHALRMTFQSQMEYATKTGMYEELMKDIKRK